MGINVISNIPSTMKVGPVHLECWLDLHGPIFLQRRYVLKALGAEMEKRWRAAALWTVDKVRPVIKQAIMDTPEYESMISGELKGHLGLSDPETKLATIISQWLKGVHIKEFRGGAPIKARVIGGLKMVQFTLRAIDLTYSDVLGLSQAQQRIASKGQIEWLDWMLKRGNKIIIHTHTVKFKKGAGRSGEAIMVKFKARSRWRVPPQFSGTPHNNFVTRALNSAGAQIRDAVIKGVYT